MISPCDRRSACLLLQYGQSLLLPTLLSSPQASKLPPLPPPTTQATQSFWLQQQQQQQQQQQRLLLSPPTNESFGNDVAVTGSKSTVTTTITPKELALFVATHTPKEFSKAIQQSGGRFLYRGEESNGEFCSRETRVAQNQPQNGGALCCVRICDPPPDLLMVETYGNDELALAYFEGLEARLSSTNVAKPSNGHIATSDPSEAGRWGPIVSVWPLILAKPSSQNSSNTELLTSIATTQSATTTPSFSYVWPKNRPVFYKSGGGSDNNNNNNNANTKYSSKDNNDVLVVNEKLRDALVARDGREVLFATPTTGNDSSSSSSAPQSAVFLSVPAELDGILRQELERIGYGL